MARKYLDDAPSRERILNDINSYKTRWEKRIDENGNIFEIPISYRDTSVKTVPWNTNRQTRKRNTKPIVKKQKSTRYKSDRKTIYTPSSSSEDTTYEVQRGDTLGDILRRHGVSTDAKTIKRIARENGIADPNKIYVGQKLNLGKTTYSKTESTSTSGKTLKTANKVTPKATSKGAPKISSSSSPTVSSSPKTSTTSGTSNPYKSRDILANSGAYNFINPNIKEAAVTRGNQDDENIRRIFSLNSMNGNGMNYIADFANMSDEERYMSRYGVAPNYTTRKGEKQNTESNEAFPLNDVHRKGEQGLVETNPELMLFPGSRILGPIKQFKTIFDVAEKAAKYKGNKFLESNQRGMSNRLLESGPKGRANYTSSSRGESMFITTPNGDIVPINVRDVSYPQQQSFNLPSVRTHIFTGGPNGMGAVPVSYPKYMYPYNGSYDLDAMTALRNARSLRSAKPINPRTLPVPYNNSNFAENIVNRGKQFFNPTQSAKPATKPTTKPTTKATSTTKTTGRATKNGRVSNATKRKKVQQLQIPFNS